MVRFRPFFRDCKCVRISQHAKSLVVTDPEFTSNKNFIKIIELLKNNKIKHSIFSNIKGNPTGKNVMDGVEHFLSNNNDGVIAIGEEVLLMLVKQLPL